MRFPAHLRQTGGLALLCLLPTTVLYAQTAAPSAVRGTLLDAAQGQPVPFANVVLYRATATDSSLVTGVQTQADGSFQLEKLGLGSYTLRATVLGYAPLRRSIALTAAAPTADLGRLRLTASSTKLGEVTVQGERAAVVDNLDKKVINVAKDLTSVGGTAVNVLQNVPSVSVDQSGQVSLRGTSNVTIYINGKPTGAAGGGRAVNLDQIPASRIETVEVITNPSAKYDAEGSGGIINIVLKKQREDGVNGNASLNLGTGDKYSASLSLNRRKGKLNLFGSYDFQQNIYWNRNTLRQLSQDADGRSTATNQVVSTDQEFLTHAGRLGLDYSFTPEHTLTLAVQPSYNENRFPEELLGTLTTRAAGVEQVDAVDGRNLTKSSYPSTDFTLDYRRSWAAQPRRELTVGAVFTPLEGQQVLSQRQTVGARPLSQEQVIDFAINQGAAQADYVHPIGEKGRIDAGVKSTYRGTDGTYAFRVQPGGSGEFQPDAARSYGYRFDEYVQAGYAQYQNETSGKLSYQAGLRVETTTLRGLLRTTGQHFDQDYVNLFPSATLSQALPHEQTLQLSYSRRINRPDVPVLLPFVNYSDPRNYRVGNPRLRPENINALELSHQKSWGAASLTTTAFYRLTENQIQRFRSVDQAASDTSGYVITRTTFTNAARNETYGLELNLSQPLTTWWRLGLNGSAFRNLISASTGTEADFRNFAYTGRLNTTITPLPRLDVQLTANYRSTTVTNQGSLGPIYFVDVAVKKDFGTERRASLTARVSDVFNTQQFDVAAYGPGLELDLTAKRETRVGWLGFSYRFGSGPAQRRPSQPSGSGAIGG